MLPMILPSVGILLVIAVMLGAAVMTTCILSKKVEAKNTDYFATLPNSNVVQKSACMRAIKFYEMLHATNHKISIL